MLERKDQHKQGEKDVWNKMTEDCEGGNVGA